MKSNREVVSEAMQRLNALNADELISKRAVLSTLRDMAAQVIRERSANRQLFQNDELYVTVQIALSPFNDKLVRSVKKIPARHDTTYGKIIRIFDTQGEVEFVATTAHEMQYKLTRRYKNPFKIYYYVENDYVYVASPDIERVKLSGIFKEPMKAKLLDINATTPACMFPLDDLFVCPQDILSVVIDMAVEKYTGKLQIRATQDENPDGNVLRK
jgi:hypothetical protein